MRRLVATVLFGLVLMGSGAEASGGGASVVKYSTDLVRARAARACHEKMPLREAIACDAHRDAFTGLPVDQE